MKTLATLLILLCPVYLFSRALQDTIKWQKLDKPRFSIVYAIEDEEILAGTIDKIENGISTIEKFFGHSFKKKFTIQLFPNRMLLDAFWQKDWNAPDFKSECWMVASGDAKGIAMLSIRAWQKQACEHDANNNTEIQKLLTHELTHVFHSQYGIPGSNEDLEPIGWFVEGLATYVSGQLDTKRIDQIKEIVREGKNATELEKFWAGKARYGQSGTMVELVDKIAGREVLFQLLEYSTEDQILKKLNVSEAELIRKWKNTLL